MIIDSHAHYTRTKFDNGFRYLAYEAGEYTVKEGSREDILAELAESAVTAFIEPGVELESNEVLLEFCREHPDVYPAVGVHPTRIGLLKRKNRAKLLKCARDESVIAIGETGLDFHQERREQYRLRQFEWFLFQINLADSKNLPLILHIRKAHRAAIAVLRLNKKKLHGGVAHCFCGTAKEAQDLFDLGLNIGIGGALLQNNENTAALEEAVRMAPLDRIIVETDAPYVLPSFTDESLSKKSIRKIRNTSLILPEVIKRIAELKGLDAKTVEDAVYANTVKLFGLENETV